MKKNQHGLFFFLWKTCGWGIFIFMNNTTLIAAFKSFIVTRAAKEGVDVSGLQVAGATLEATWGDLHGFVFFGCSDEINERIANCFERFAAKNAKTGSYEAQRSVGVCGPRYFHKYVNGAEHWTTSDAASPYTALAQPIVKGYSVSTTYYPCAD